MTATNRRHLKRPRHLALSTELGSMRPALASAAQTKPDISKPSSTAQTPSAGKTAHPPELEFASYDVEHERRNEQSEQ